MPSTTARPRGARLSGRIAASITSTASIPSASAATAADDSAGTDDTPDSTATPAALASASRTEIPAQNAASSATSR
jgi:hypothetical protein